MSIKNYKAYGSALFSFGKKEDKLQIFQDNFKVTVALINKNNEYQKVLNSPLISKKDKELSLHKIFDGTLDPDFISFLKVLCAKHVINHLNEIYFEFNHQYNNFHNILEGIIYSKYPLSKTNLNKLTKYFSKKYNKTVVFKTIIHNSLLAGLKIYIDNTLYDYSLDTKIKNIQQTLLQN